jgi:hypothetical protein
MYCRICGKGYLTSADIDGVCYSCKQNIYNNKQVVEYKINSFEDRNNAVMIFSNAGYKVSIRKEVTRQHNFYTEYDYFVLIE